MTADSPFLLSVAALSASLAGLAGLVAALRRGEGLSANDRFRLHEIVEFCFANIVLAIGIIPLTTISGSTETALRIGGGVALAYTLINMVVLTRRARMMSIQLTWGWVTIVLALNIAAIVASTAALLTGALGAYQALLLVLLVRPMAAFLFVLSSFEAGGETRGAR
ncbi:MAG TPA: hypothetical protein VLR93_07905 [Patescibacteria group bacterium]|nr:hypothetical protein [Patescibacteria group bacterium]